VNLTTHFHVSEFACRDGTPVPEEYFDNLTRLCHRLETLRGQLGKPIIILSGYRTPSWNRHKGVEHSQHLTASAADIRVKDVPPRDVRFCILRLIDAGRMSDGGLGLYEASNSRRLGWVHVDIGPPRRWRG
jgi:uncharacterized protein YcbK (DUF882 family)